MDETATTKSGSAFKERETGSRWRSEHDFPTDDDLAGCTVVSWDVDDGDDVPFPVSEYRKIVSTLRQLQEREA